MFAFHNEVFKYESVARQYKVCHFYSRKFIGQTTKTNFHIYFFLFYSFHFYRTKHFQMNTPKALSSDLNFFQRLIDLKKTETTCEYDGK